MLLLWCKTGVKWPICSNFYYTTIVWCNGTLKISSLEAEVYTAWKVSKYGDFLVRIFRYLDWIQGFTPYISVFCPNTGKYGPEKTPYLETFHAVLEDMKKQLCRGTA